ncbi:hypothetical protein GE061_001792 [Apolygus lucorum]|uniref:Uncharacterized protein n=1 Tax=Apolygus lucorum TaxID=248454 RepID=A0A8S9X556_APOLU|nr:hypothetical protein GE061_001792 [Apolygus lucorum]
MTHRFKIVDVGLPLDGILGTDIMRKLGPTVYHEIGRKLGLTVGNPSTPTPRLASLAVDGGGKWVKRMAEKVDELALRYGRCPLLSVSQPKDPEVGSVQPPKLSRQKQQNENGDPPGYRKGPDHWLMQRAEVKDVPGSDPIVALRKIPKGRVQGQKEPDRSECEEEVTEALASRRQVVPALSRALVAVLVPGEEGSEVLLEPYELPQSGLRGGRSVGKISQGQAWMSVVNLTKGDMVVDRHQRLAETERVVPQYSIMVAQPDTGRRGEEESEGEKQGPASEDDEGVEYRGRSESAEEEVESNGVLRPSTPLGRESEGEEQSETGLESSEEGDSGSSWESFSHQSDNGSVHSFPSGTGSVMGPVDLVVPHWMRGQATTSHLAVAGSSHTPGSDPSTASSSPLLSISDAGSLTPGQGTASTPGSIEAPYWESDPRSLGPHPEDSTPPSPVPAEVHPEVDVDRRPQRTRCRPRRFLDYEVNWKDE